MKEKTKGDVEGYLAKLDPLFRELVDKLRRVILRSVPDLEEVIKWGNLVYERKGKICGIVVHKSHINLQIWRGAELTDPEHLLEGSGKNMRHIKIRKANDIKVDAFAALIKEAAELEVRR